MLLLLNLLNDEFNFLTELLTLASGIGLPLSAAAPKLSLMCSVKSLTESCFSMAKSITSLRPSCGSCPGLLEQGTCTAAAK